MDESSNGKLFMSTQEKPSRKRRKKVKSLNRGYNYTKDEKKKYKNVKSKVQSYSGSFKVKSRIPKP